MREQKKHHLLDRQPYSFQRRPGGSSRVTSCRSCAQALSEECERCVLALSIGRQVLEAESKRQQPPLWLEFALPFGIVASITVMACLYG